ncbi:sugar phosphotransferase [Streptomyces ipomoeae]|nr:sugar phosphotransferase [Streptomyces ipomoeae]
MDRDTAAQGRHVLVRLGGWLASGAPYLGTLIALGGVLTVLAYVLGGNDITSTASDALASGDWTRPETWAGLFLKCGVSVLEFLPPLIAGYVAYGIGGRAALVPGAIGGMAAMLAQTGFLGGVVAGVAAGAVTVLLGRVPVPSALRTVVTGLLVPLAAAAFAGYVMIGFVGEQLGSFQDWLNGPLTRLEFHDSVLLGLVLGLLTCSDLGGALGRTALGFGIVGVGTAHPSTLNMTIMAAVVAAGMVPALGLSLATAVRRSRFTPAEREYGKVAWLLGAASVPEGAIPYAIGDPLRVLPATMAGGAVTGALTVALGGTTAFPYGGLLTVGQFGRPLLLVAAVAVGTLITAGTVLALKSLGGKKAQAQAPAAERPKKTGARTKVRLVG